ncbi:MAG: hypothetical protein FD130_2281 [Halothiobacillaceae bacterium]|nr:MAG: hypothetical protein FD130_2281 [Halothiobacillaceae bacterium]
MLRFCKIVAALTTLLTLSYGHLVLAEPIGTVSPKSAQHLPTRSMTMERVKEQFGPPITMLDPIGTPAISRWRYDGYTVYFENNHVIHTVVDPKKAAP